MAEQHKDDEGKRSGRRTGVHTLVGHHKQDEALITRSYKGRVLQVKVLPKGFEFEGAVYKSLSAVAFAGAPGGGAAPWPWRP